MLREIDFLIKKVPVDSLLIAHV